MTEKLGEKALEAMKKMDNAVVEFKIPKAPKTKKGNMKILTEEQYIEVMHCIRYFVMLIKNLLIEIQSFTH